MEEAIKQKINFKEIMQKVWKALHNQTFLYIVKRILSSLLTTVLIVAVVIALIRVIPETKFYSLDTYNKLSAKGAIGATAANRYKAKCLYSVGRCQLDGTPISVIESILQYLYWIFPIKKEICIKWTSNYEPWPHDTAENIAKGYWTGYVYFGRTNSLEYVTDVLTSRMGISFKITIWTVFFTYLISYPLGIAMAKKPGGIIDKIGNVFIVLNYAIPALVFYLFMSKILGNPNGIFGSWNLGYVYDAEHPVKTLIAPIFCMVFLSIPGVIIYLRRFMIDELTSDYVKFARSKGLSENRIMYTHVLRNAIVPLVRNIPATFITAIIGSYFVEKIWNIPGTGILLLDSINTNFDLYLLQGLTVIYAMLSMASFLLGDIITVFFDPRIKLES